MMLTHKVRLDEIYIPVKLKKEIDPAKVGALAESILEKGLDAGTAFEILSIDTVRF